MKPWLFSLLIIPAIAITAAVWAFSGPASAEQKDLELIKDGQELVVRTQISRPAGKAITQPTVIKDGDQYILSYRLIYAEDTVENGLMTEVIEWRLPDTEANLAQMSVRNEGSVNLSQKDIERLLNPKSM